MNTQTEKKNKVLALVFTLGFHALLFLLFILIVFITPIPPFEIVPVPEIEIGLGMEGFGQNAGGSGQNEPDLTTTSDAVKDNLIAENAPNIITDNTETESVVIKSNPNNTKPSTSETVTTEVPKPSSELQKALDALKNKKKHNGKGDGGGNTGGSGDGTGKGVGDGNNPEEGNNPNGGSSGKGGYDLKGRQLLKRPASMTDTEEEGVVVVEIIVDENGKVKKATPGQRGSTTTSATLYAKARLAALQAKFNTSPDGTTEQRGTYTFVFTLE